MCGRYTLSNHEAAALAAALKQVLAPAPDDLLVTQAASPRVNSGRIDDPDLLDPAK
ncbi:MAG: hypothetical protein ACREQF_05940 [Candidatus Binataceae bacterium]